MSLRARQRGRTHHRLSLQRQWSNDNPRERQLAVVQRDERDWHRVQSAVLQYSQSLYDGKIH